MECTQEENEFNKMNQIIEEEAKRYYLKHYKQVDYDKFVNTNEFFKLKIKLFLNFNEISNEITKKVLHLENFIINNEKCINGSANDFSRQNNMLLYILH
jgi:hypothetical protein